MLSSPRDGSRLAGSALRPARYRVPDRAIRTLASVARKHALKEIEGSVASRNARHVVHDILDDIAGRGKVAVLSGTIFVDQFVPVLAIEDRLVRVDLDDMVEVTGLALRLSASSHPGSKDGSASWRERVCQWG